MNDRKITLKKQQQQQPNSDPPPHLFGVILLLLREEVRTPVGHVEEGEHQRERDAGDDVDALAPRGELGQPGPTAVLARRLQVDLTRARLLAAHSAVVSGDQRLLHPGEGRHRRREKEKGREGDR